uniref:NADH:ubiquinone reductase (non-electrogenic) n=1 Tax=Quercus lobata TaxID=97700 RepID=A0A7N2REP1_QUELO
MAEAKPAWQRRRLLLLLFVLLLPAWQSDGGLVSYAEANSTNGAPAIASSESENVKKKVVVLGTGWAGTSFLKNLNNPTYDVQVISPRNYFAFTPLLPSVTCGTVEPRSIVEPIRNIVRKVIESELHKSVAVLCDYVR